MRDKRLTHLFFVIAVSFSLLGYPFLAQADPVATPSEMVQGAAALRKGDVDLAISYYCRVLARDLKNQEALQSLQRIVQRPSLSPQQNLRLIRVFELMDYIEFLKQRVLGLNDSIEQKKAGIMKIAGRDNFVARAFELIEIEINDRYLQEAVVYDRTKNYDFPLTQSLDHLTSVLNTKKNQYIELVELLKRKMARLEGLNIKTDDVIIENTADSPQSISIPDQSQRQDSLKVVHREISLLKERVRISEDKVEKLTDDLTDKAMELYEKGRSLIDQKNRADKVEKDLVDTKERLSLVQRILLEKDEKIAALEKYAQDIATDSKSDTEEMENQLSFLQSKLADVQEQLSKQKDLSEEKILFLEKLLAQQELKFAEYEQAFSRKDEQLFDFNKIILRQAEQLNRINGVLLSKDDKILEMDGILRIYQGKLSEANERLTSPVYNSALLKVELMAARDQLDDSHKTTSALYQRIRLLETQFSNIKMIMSNE